MLLVAAGLQRLKIDSGNRPRRALKRSGYEMQAPFGGCVPRLHSPARGLHLVAGGFTRRRAYGAPEGEPCPRVTNGKNTRYGPVAPTATGSASGVLPHGPVACSVTL